MNPMIGSSLKHGCGVEEEQTVEVVRNHEDGTRMGNGLPIPKGVEESRQRSNRHPGVGLLGLDDGGAIFGQPHERQPGFAAGSQGPERVGKVGAKVRRVARGGRKVRRADRSKVLEGRSAKAPQGRGGQQ
jgi:hypothetical protein